MKVAVKCNPALAEQINAMVALLQKHYNVDFSFVIYGKGHLLAASNLTSGFVPPIPDLPPPTLCPDCGSPLSTLLKRCPHGHKP